MSHLGGIWETEKSQKRQKVWPLDFDALGETSTVHNVQPTGICLISEMTNLGNPEPPAF